MARVQSLYRVVLRSRVLDEAAEAAWTSGGREIGGWIIGRYDHDRVWIDLLERDTGAEESPGGVMIKSIPPHELLRGREIVGLWHTHPHGAPHYSCRDLRTMENWIRAVTLTDVPYLKPKLYMILATSRSNVHWALYTPVPTVDLRIRMIHVERGVTSRTNGSFGGLLSLGEGGFKEALNGVEQEIRAQERLTAILRLKRDFLRLIEACEGKGVIGMDFSEGFALRAYPYQSLIMREISRKNLLGVWLLSHAPRFTPMEKAFLQNFSLKTGKRKFWAIKILEGRLLFLEAHLKPESFRVRIRRICGRVHIEGG